LVEGIARGLAHQALGQVHPLWPRATGPRCDRGAGFAPQHPGVLLGLKERAPRMGPASGKLAAACSRGSIRRRCSQKHWDGPV
jgi:hypothetical protein